MQRLFPPLKMKIFHDFDKHYHDHLTNESLKRQDETSFLSISQMIESLESLPESSPDSKGFPAYQVY